MLHEVKLIFKGSRNVSSWRLQALPDKRELGFLASSLRNVNSEMVGENTHVGLSCACIVFPLGFRVVNITGAVFAQLKFQTSFRKLTAVADSPTKRKTERNIAAKNLHVEV